MKYSILATWQDRERSVTAYVEDDIPFLPPAGMLFRVFQCALPVTLGEPFWDRERGMLALSGEMHVDNLDDIVGIFKMMNVKHEVRERDG